ncbi:class I SAM-dependent methyltransferase [Fodinibius sp. AD559]|uniref:class I SAM-dependent methyltransferase n=1 Tax=Fodinibius sp. AD559 TaxID=3424179 RepID=UPI004046A55B
MHNQTSTKLFSKKSTAYAKYRAGYNDEAITKIIAPFQHQDVINIVDIGAGTGIGSYLLAEKGAFVTAVEPNKAMIETAEPHPNINFIQASAEQSGIADNTADIVTSFQAFHWFEFKKSLQEFRRILKPSGQLALIWNYWDTTDPFTKAYVKLIDKATVKNEDRVEPYDGISGKIKKLRVHLLWKIQYLPYYKNVQRHVYQLSQEMDLDGLIGVAKSQSYIEHKGPLWDDLEADIISLANKNESTNLVYNVNLFTATPRK